jgi:uncharacterized membrane protein YcgQ (UPF0703/DUF1980 family)
MAFLSPDVVISFRTSLYPFHIDGTILAFIRMCEFVLYMLISVDWLAIHCTIHQTWCPGHGAETKSHLDWLHRLTTTGLLTHR